MYLIYKRKKILLTKRANITSRCNNMLHLWKNIFKKFHKCLGKFILRQRLFKKAWWRIKKRFKDIFKFPNNDINKFILLLRKRVYPYEYIAEQEKFNETSVAEKEKFYSNLCFGEKLNSLWDFWKLLNFNTVTCLQNFVNI